MIICILPIIARKLCSKKPIRHTFPYIISDFVSLYLHHIKYLFIMPPKRKRDITSVTDDKDKVHNDEISNPSKRTRAVRKELPPQTFSDSESEPELKKTKKKSTKTKVTVDVKPKRGRKPVAKPDDSDDDEIPTKERKIPEKAQKNAKTAASAVKNKTATNYEDIDFSNCSRKSALDKEYNFKISNWNVDGIRAWLKKGGLEFINYEKPDIFCLQETKCSLDKLPPEVKEVDGYKVYWHCSAKDGYAGVALYSKSEPLSIQYGVGHEEHDDEGRMITAEYEKFYVISVYVPNAGRGLVTLPKRLKWNDIFRKFVAQLDKKKPVIVCGDMNVAHLEIDLANPKTNTKNAGFTKEERDGMTEFLSDGYIDTFRNLYPDKTQAYTFWTYMANCRAKNIGWRLDYFIVSNKLLDNVCDNVIRSEVFGSDHCPITLFLYV